jgi:hypothetical protein
MRRQVALLLLLDLANSGFVSAPPLRMVFATMPYIYDRDTKAWAKAFFIRRYRRLTQIFSGRLLGNPRTGP